MVDKNKEQSNSTGVVKSIKTFFLIEGREISEQEFFDQLISQESIKHPDLGKIRKYRGKFGEFWLTSRNNIIHYFGAALAGENKQIDSSRAYNLAVSFAQKHVDDFMERNFEAQPVYIDEKSLTLKWDEKPKPDIETSIFSNWVEVVVDLHQGKVKRFFASDARLVRTTDPKINRQQAETKIKEQFEKSAIQSLELMEQPLIEQSKVITIWTALVLIHGDHGPETIRITFDADTGEEFSD